MDLKQALIKIFRHKQLTTEQLNRLAKLQPSSNLETEKRSVARLNWGFVAISFSLVCTLLVQWYVIYYPQQPRLDVATSANDTNNVLVDNLVMSLAKEIPVEKEIESFSELPKYFNKLDFVPIDPSRQMPYQNFRLLGASYLMLGDSLGVYLVLENTLTEKRLVMIQRPLKTREQVNNPILQVIDGINVRIWNEQGVLTAVGW